MTHNTESRLGIGTGKCTVCRHVRALFSLEIVQAVAVKGFKGKLALITYLCAATLLNFAFSLLNLPPHSSPTPHNPSPSWTEIYTLVIDCFLIFFTWLCLLCCPEL